MTMNWNNLKEFTCPDCKSVLVEVTMGYRCSVCKFQIGHEKFQSVVRKLYGPKNKAYNAEGTEERNQDWLNEL